MVPSEEQSTEVEVLKSIFDGDERFSVIDGNKFQVKEYIIESLMKESEPYLGMAVTFTLIEYAKEHLDDLLKDQNEAAVLAAETSELRVDDSESESDESKNGMFGMKGKTQMTKAQKRRMWDRTDASKHGQMERGWNWVDILRHLSQTRDN